MKQIFFLIILICPNASFAQEKFVLNSQKIIEGLNEPVVAVFPPELRVKFILAEKSGKIFWVDKETKALNLYFDISQEGKSIKFVDLILHPDYDKNNRVFLAFYELLNESIDLVVQEYQPSEHGKLELYKEVLRLRLHSKKLKDFSLAIDSGKNLLIALPDGAQDYDPKEQAQNRDLLWGKVLRFDIKDTEYIAPLDNPFVMEKIGRKEIYATGFREPADMFLDEESKTIFISDRGKDTFSEVNILKSGANYGWSSFEGTQCLRMQMECNAIKYEKPLFEYPFKKGRKISISPTISIGIGAKKERFNLVHDSITGFSLLINKEKTLELSIKPGGISFISFFKDYDGNLYGLSNEAVFSLSTNQSKLL